MTAILILLLMGVSNAWAYNEYNKRYLYFDGSAFTAFFSDNCKPYISPKWDYNGNDGNSNGGDKEMTQIGSTNYYYLDLSQSSGSYKNFRGFYIGRSSSFYNGKNMGVVDGSVNNCINATGWGTYSWTNFAPPMKSASIENTSTVYGGDGTQGNPYQIKKGTTISVSATATSTVTADNQTKYYKFYKKENNGSRTSVGSESTTTTSSFTASSTVGTKYAVDVEARNEYYGTYGEKATSSTLYFITIEPIYAILGSFNNWTHSANTWDLSDQGSNNWKATFHLDKGSHTFKVVYNSSYYGKNNITITRASATASSLSTSGGNINLTTDIAGDYTFTFNSSNNNLSVTYPEAYTVTYSRTPTAAADAPTTNPSITSGDYVLANTSVTFTARDANNGYTWKGWYENEDGEGTALSANKEYTKSINANTTIYAVYTINTYNITYNLNGGTNPDGIATQYQVTTATITLPTPTRTGYTFAGWYDNDELTGNKVTQIAKGSYGDKEYWAKWTANTYTITWDANGGSVDPTSSTYTYDGATVTMPTPTRTGYTFDGWFTAASDGTQITEIGTTNKPTSNVTYYAHWTENIANITISSADANKGTVSPTSASVGVTTKVTVTASPIDGYYTQTWTATAPAVSSETTGNTTTLSGNGNTGNGTLVATFSERYQLISKHATNTIPSDKPYFTKQNDGSWTCTATLAANTQYSFKVKDYGNSGNEYGTSTSSNQECADWVKVWAAANSSLLFTSTQAGTYTFTIRWAADDDNSISLTAPQVKITYPAIPAPADIAYSATRVYEENTISGWIAGDGTEANPYRLYNDESVQLTITELSDVQGLTRYYQVGETVQTTNIFSITTITTEVTPITITTYYQDTYGNKNTKEKTIYFQKVLTPELVLITNPATEISLGSIQAGNTITLSYSATYNGYSGNVTITQDQIIGNTTTTTTLTTTTEDKYTYTYTNTSLNSPCIIAFTAQTTKQHGRIFKAHTEVAVYKNVTIKVNDTNGVMNKVYMWRGGDSEAADVKTEWPGESFLQEFGTWHVFTVKYPYYDLFVLNNGSNGNQTFDYEIPDEDKCYQLSDSKVAQGGYTNYTLTETKCPGNLIVSGIEASYEVTEGDEFIISPSISLGLGYALSDITTTITCNSGSSYADAIVSGTAIRVAGKSAGDANFTVTYKLEDETYTFTFTVTVIADNSVTIQVKVPTNFGDGNAYQWTDNSKVYIYSWWGDANSRINMTYVYTSNGYYHFQADVPLNEIHKKINLLVYYGYTDSNARWRQTDDVYNVDKDGCYTLYKNGVQYTFNRGISRSGDNCWDEDDYSQYYIQVVMAGSGKTYTSNTISTSSEILSFFAPGKNETDYNRGTVYLYKDDRMYATIPAATFDESNVYVANLNDTKDGLTNVAPYTGNYYIRTYGDNDWGQNTYQQWSDDQRSQRKFTYFVPRKEELYNHYWVDDLEYYSGGKDVSGYVANIYNNDLAGKLVTDHTGTTDATGKIYYGSSEKANVRFGYDPRTNYFCRAILKGSSESNDFLNLYCVTAYQDEDCTELVNNGTLKDSKLDDASNWVYEKEFYVPITNTNPTASVYLSATAYNDARNLLLGYEVDENTGEEDVNRPKQRTIIGSGTANGTYHMRIIYDFKTNRLITAWEPQDGITFSEKTTIHSDVLIIRHENNAAPQINLTNAGKVKSLETMYFALEFERGSENASKRHQEQYWFTLPFNCRVGEISGVPGYMQTWGIQRYRGDLRAQKGWFAETPTFWEWLSPNDILEAGEGYLLVFDKKAASWAEFEVRDDDGNVTETRSILRLYFPSTTSGFDLQQQSTEHLTRTYENHTCTIQLHNRYLQDSNWKVIGTTSYNNAGITECTADTDPTYEELTEAPSFRYKYEYTMSDDNKTFWYKYTAEDGKAATYNSFFGYMVQFAGTIQWQPIMSETVPEGIAARRYVPANERTSFTTRLEMTDANGEKQDQTFVALDEKATTGFDQNKDLNKVLNRGTNIYTFVEGLPFAGNTLPMEKVTVPVGVRVDAAGEYTFRMPDGTDGIAVTLVDNATGTHTNMLMSEYTVTLNAGTIENRFYLMVDPDRTATSVENIGEEAKGDKAKDVEKFLIDGKLFIRTADGIFDAKGQRL